MNYKKAIKNLLEIINQSSKHKFAIETTYMGYNIYNKHEKDSGYGRQIIHTKTEYELYNFLHGLREYLLIEGLEK